jgi:phage-related protein
MATFNDATVGTSTGGTTPDFNASKQSEPQIRTVKFGDGYQQRLQYGLNTNPKTWDLKWTAKTNADADAIEAFFDARANDAASFTWTPPAAGGAGQYICRQWTRTLDYANINTITATFVQVYEP